MWNSQTENEMTTCLPTVLWLCCYYLSNPQKKLHTGLAYIVIDWGKRLGLLIRPVYFQSCTWVAWGHCNKYVSSVYFTWPTVVNVWQLGKNQFPHICNTSLYIHRKFLYRRQCRKRVKKYSNSTKGWKSLEIVIPLMDWGVKIISPTYNNI